MAGDSADRRVVDRWSPATPGTAIRRHGRRVARRDRSRLRIGSDDDRSAALSRTSPVVSGPRNRGIDDSGHAQRRHPSAQPSCSCRRDRRSLDCGRRRIAAAHPCRRRLGCRRRRRPDTDPDAYAHDRPSRCHPDLDGHRDRYGSGNVDLAAPVGPDQADRPLRRCRRDARGAGASHQAGRGLVEGSAEVCRSGGRGRRRIRVHR